MAISAILAAALIAPAQDPTPFSQAQGVAEPTRLALTPVIDGSLQPDEWDAFAKTDAGATYMQWEPGKLYFAGKMPVDSELVVSLDNKQNGWLVGKDNFEFRIRFKDGQASVVTRQLDATQVAGPTWQALPQFDKAAKVAGKEVDGMVEVEAAIVDPGLNLLNFRDDERYMVRMDVVAQSSQTADPFYPRVGTLVKLSKERASAMPVGLDWGVEQPGRAIIPGTSAKVRFTFNSKADPGIKKVDIRPMGALAEHAGTTLGEPFPSLDNKGRAFVDYDAKTSKDAPMGYHLVSTTLVTADGVPAVIQASVRIAAIVDIDLPEDHLVVKPGQTEVKIPFYVKSNSIDRLEGTLAVELPTGWQLDKSDPEAFRINTARGGVRSILSMKIPDSVAGTAPVKFTAEVGKQKVTQTFWVTIVRK
jgi:hypothetical protein